MYIGRQPLSGNYQICDALSASATATYALTVSSVAVFPESSSHVVCSLNGIIQKPGSSFSISGSNIVFSSSLTSSDSIDFILLLGNTLDVGTVSDATITNAKLAQDIISGETALTSEPDATDELLLSDAGTLKRIDYSLISNRPSFLANRSGSTQTISNNTNTTVIFDNEVIDTDSGYDTSTGIFTVPTAGKYFICGAPTLTAAGAATIFRTFITKNGTSTVVARGDIRPGDNGVGGFGENTPPCSAILDLSASDTLRVMVRFEGGNGNERVSHSSSGTASQFFGYKLTGI